MNGRRGGRRRQEIASRFVEATDVLDNLEPFRITQARQLRGMSAKQLAEALETTERTVFYWESNTLLPTPPQIEAMAKLLEVPLKYFMRGRPMPRLDSSQVWIC